MGHHCSVLHRLTVVTPHRLTLATLTGSPWSPSQAHPDHPHRLTLVTLTGAPWSPSQTHPIPPEYPEAIILQVGLEWGRKGKGNLLLYV